MGRGSLKINRARIRTILLFEALVIYAFYFQVYPNLPRGQLLALGTFLASGRAIDMGLPPYGSHREIYDAIGSNDYSPNLNPPVTLLLFQRIAWIDPQVAFRSWYAITILLFLLALAMVYRAYPEHVTLLRVTWALSSVGLWATLREGQLYMPLALATIGAWLLLRRDHPVPAGILIGILVAIKPNYAVWPVLLLLVGIWPATLAAGCVVSLLSLAPLYVYGTSVYTGWLNILPSGESLASPVNASLTGFATRFGMAPIGEIASAALLLTLAWWTWRRRPDVLQVSSIALVASMLASPLSWLHYSVILLPVFFSRSWTPAWWACALLLLVPDYLLWYIQFHVPQWTWEAGIVSTGTLTLLLILLVRPVLLDRVHRPGVDAVLVEHPHGDVPLPGTAD